MRKMKTVDLKRSFLFERSRWILLSLDHTDQIMMVHDTRELLVYGLMTSKKEKIQKKIKNKIVMELPFGYKLNMVYFWTTFWILRMDLFTHTSKFAKGWSVPRFHVS
ncbi:hypothetical protein P8452_21271 [Trifolium repens]|nr:hypothetical protein P8452_21271 [Trifolium repens]